MRALRYAVEEAAVSLWRGRYSGLLSTATIAVALFVLGTFLAVTSNLQRLSSEWSNAAEMSVYLKDQATPADRSAIEAVLTPGSVVAGREYVSKATRSSDSSARLAIWRSATDGLSANPLPASDSEAGTLGSGVEERPSTPLALRCGRRPGWQTSATTGNG
jgi:cell division transport system permease protein